jgi:hypothetical protein
LQSNSGCFQLNLAPAQLNLAPAQLNLAPAQLNLASAQLNLASAQLNLASAQLNLASAQLNLASAQLNLASAQLNLASLHANLGSVHSIVGHLNYAESVRQFQPRVGFETLGHDCIEKCYATLKELPLGSPNCGPRRNSFRRVARDLKAHFETQGFKANPGLEFANAFSV